MKKLERAFCDHCGAEVEFKLETDWISCGDRVIADNIDLCDFCKDVLSKYIVEYLEESMIITYPIKVGESDE